MDTGERERERERAASRHQSVPPGRPKARVHCSTYIFGVAAEKYI